MLLALDICFAYRYNISGTVDDMILDFSKIKLIPGGKLEFQFDPSRWVWLIDSYTTSHVQGGERGTNTPLQFYLVSKGQTSSDGSSWGWVHCRHSKTAHAAFIDGHAEALDAKSEVSNRTPDNVSFGTLEYAFPLIIVQ